MAENNLIHAGLPWTNPAKITIKSSEFINDVTINRGLLNLLNNDYYLDLKSEAINKYLETIVQDHINDDSIHFEWSDVKDLFDRIACLSSNAGYRIPIRKPGGNGTAITTAEIMSIVNKIPRNLNGYTLVLELCVPKSAAGNATGLKTSFNGKGTSPGNTYSYDFGSKSLNIEDFFGGTLIIWANNQYFIDDSDINKFNEPVIGSELNDTLKYLQDKILSPVNGASISSDLIPLRGNAINSRYSVVSLRNLLCDTYMYNMNVTNTLSSTDNIGSVIDGMEFPEISDVICMWPLEKDTSYQYQNESVLGTIKPKFTEVVNLIGDHNSIFSTDNSNNTLSCASLNFGYTDAGIAGSQPDYLIFDTTFDADSNKVYSNAFRDIIYGNGNTTLMFWAKLTDYITHSPIIVDALPNNRTEGLYFYLDQILRADSSYPDKAPYQSSHQSYFNDNTNDPLNSYYNKWALYVIEFQHTVVPNSVTDRAPYNKSIFKSIQTSGDMRINMTVYWNPDGNVNSDPKSSLLLYPNMNTYKSATSRTMENDLVSAGYQFKNPIYSTTNVLRFFANQVTESNNSTETTSIFNFNFFAGYLRNMIMFNRFLDTNEIYSMFKQGPSTLAYDWYDTGEYEIISQLTSNNYFGTVYAHNVKQLNLINNIFTQTAK